MRSWGGRLRRGAGEGLRRWRGGGWSGGGGYGAVPYLDDPRGLSVGPLRSRGIGGVVSIMGGMSVGEFAQRVGITPASLALTKNGPAKAVSLPRSHCVRGSGVQAGGPLTIEPGDG